MYVFRLVLYRLNFIISLLSRFVKPARGTIYGFLLQHHHFLLNESPFCREMDNVVLWLFWPKTHVCVVVDQ